MWDSSALPGQLRSQPQFHGENRDLEVAGGLENCLCWTAGRPSAWPESAATRSRPTCPTSLLPVRVHPQVLSDALLDRLPLRIHVDAGRHNTRARNIRGTAPGHAHKKNGFPGAQKMVFEGVLQTAWSGCLIDDKALASGGRRAGPRVLPSHSSARFLALTIASQAWHSSGLHVQLIWTHVALSRSICGPTARSSSDCRGFKVFAKRDLEEL